MALVPIHLDIEEIAFIPVLRVIKGLPGVARVHFDLDGLGNKRGGKFGPRPETGNGTDHAGERSGIRPFLLKALFELPRTLADLAVVNTAYKKASMGQELSQLRRNGIVERDGLGVWSLTPDARARIEAGEEGPQEVKALPPPDKKARNAIPGVTVAMVVLAAVRSGVTRRRDIGPYLAAKGYAPNIDGPLAKAKAAGLIDSRDGVLSVTAKGRKVTLPPEALPSARQE